MFRITQPKSLHMTFGYHPRMGLIDNAIGSGTRPGTRMIQRNHFQCRYMFFIKKALHTETGALPVLIMPIFQIGGWVKRWDAEPATCDRHAKFMSIAEAALSLLAVHAASALQHEALSVVAAIDAALTSLICSIDFSGIEFRAVDT